MTLATFVLVYTLWLKGVPLPPVTYREGSFPTYLGCLEYGYAMRLRFARWPLEKQEFKCIKEEET